MNETRRSFFEIFLGLSSIVFILLGAYIALPAVSTLYNIQASRSWPQVTGKILSSRVERRWASRGDDLGQDYLSRIWFSYTVNGRDYVSGTLSFAQPWSKLLSSAQALADRYPAGKAVTVYCDPADPSIAILDLTVIPPMECVRFGIGLLFVFTGIVSLFSFLFKGRAP